jgi:hypothetical protein
VKPQILLINDGRSTMELLCFFGEEVSTSGAGAEKDDPERIL